MWLYHGILKISWIDGRTNKEVLSKMKKELKISNTAKIRILKYFTPHIMRNEYGFSIVNNPWDEAYLVSKIQADSLQQQLQNFLKKQATEVR